MKNVNLRVFCGAVTVSVALWFAGASGVARAGGFKIQDQSTRAMGMCDAFIAGADDASAVYYNPAGLTRLGRPQAIANVYLAHGRTSYDGPGGDDTSDGRYYVVPSLYFGTPIPGTEQRVFAGLGIYSPFGLGSKWSDDSPVRYYGKLSEIQLVNINPTVAVKVTDCLAIGGGIDYYTSRIINRYQMPYDVNMDMIPDTEGEVDMDADGDGWGYNLGLQWQMTDDVILGLTYRSQVSVDYDGDMQFKDVPMFGKLTTDASSTIDFPATVGAGLSWQATSKLRLEVAAEWQQWSTRDKQVIRTDGIAQLGLPPGPLPSDPTIDWQDTWVLMVGGEYQVNDCIVLRAGYGFNETPVPSRTADPSLPTGDTHAFALGFGYRINHALSLDLAGIVAIADQQTLTNDRAPYDSQYDAISAYVSVGITYTF